MLADLLLCPQQCVLRMASKCPEVLTMTAAEVTQRLMLLKVLACTAMTEPHVQLGLTEPIVLSTRAGSNLLQALCF